MRSMQHVETWKDIPEWEGLYQISDLGRVKTLSRLVRYQDTFRSQKEKILKPRLTQGYAYVILCNDTKRVQVKVHRLVAETFIPNPKNLPVVMHIDDVRDNNVVSNLQWGTVADNNKDRDTKGNTYTPKSEDAPFAVLTLEQAKEVYKLAHEGQQSQKDIGNLFGITQTAVSKIKHGVSWPDACSA